MKIVTPFAILLSLFFSEGALAQPLNGTSWRVVSTGIELHFSAVDTMSIKPSGGSLTAIANYVVSSDTVTITDFNPASTGCPSPGVYQYNIQGNTLTLTVISDNCADRANFITGGGGTWTRMGIGMAEIGSEELLKIYPVPAQSVLFVELFEKNELDYYILSITGSQLKNGMLSDTRNEVNIDDLPSGVYFLNIPEWGQTIRFNKI